MYRIEWKTNETNLLSTARAICEVKTEHTRLKHVKPKNKLSRCTNPFELVNFLLIKGIRVGKMTKLSSLIGLVKHVFSVSAVAFISAHITNEVTSSKISL
jgi:hypothetical protein